MTLEDPVEYQLPLIRQSNVPKARAWIFLNGIKSLMRQDPDIVFVGEVRDEDTALMAVRAALNRPPGIHPRFTPNDALGSIPRLGDIGVPSHLLAGSLIGVLAAAPGAQALPALQKIAGSDRGAVQNSRRRSQKTADGLPGARLSEM